LFYHGACHNSLGVEHSLSKRKVVGSNPACGFQASHFCLSFFALGEFLVVCAGSRLALWSLGVVSSLPTQDPRSVRVV
jgi:hypothetical protein